MWYGKNRKHYPIVLTRDMDKARVWLHSKTREAQKAGRFVSKTSARFKPLAIRILEQGDKNDVHCFLENRNNVRSSNYLEDAATEIQVQELELD